ncbi:MAG: hypothetical protein WB868_19430 [Xanthobacteraceae bacterium]
MSERALGSLQSDRPSDHPLSMEPHASAPRGRDIETADDTNTLTRFEQDQLAREYADIERASVALRLGQPELRSWREPARSVTAKKPRTFWLWIGVLWVSTAVVTIGAIAVIATLAG